MLHRGPADNCFVDGDNFKSQVLVKGEFTGIFPKIEKKGGLIESAEDANDAAAGFSSTATLFVMMNRFIDGSRGKVN